MWKISCLDTHFPPPCCERAEEVWRDCPAGKALESAWSQLLLFHQVTTNGEAPVLNSVYSSMRVGTIQFDLKGYMKWCEQKQQLGVSR